MGDISGKVVSITGASLAVYDREPYASKCTMFPMFFHSEGPLGVTGRFERGESAAKELGPTAVAIQLDVTDLASIAASAKRVRKELGRLNMLIQNAAVPTTREQVQTP